MSAVARHQVFSALQTVGGLLPTDILNRISEGRDVDGCLPSDYHVVGSRSVADEAERHWDYLKSIWRDLRARLPLVSDPEEQADPTGVATSQWLVPLFAELGFGELTDLGTSGITSDDGSRTFAISHRWNHLPVHLVAWSSCLDTRPAGIGKVPPQSLMQECLNRSDSHLWGVLSNGRRLRLLRDSSAMATASYLEFDLEAIFDGELFSEYLLLYRLLHASRFAISEGATPATCWLEKWRLDAISSGTRALDQLRDGVQQAITILGTGFLRHPANEALRANVDVHALHGALLRLVYRLLFVFVAEDRGLLLTPEADEAARERYAKYFSTAKLRAHARRRRGTSHQDLYQALRFVLDALGNEHGRPELGLPALGGIFDNGEADAPLHGLSLSNEYLLSAVRHLAEVRDANSRRMRAVDYQHLDAEELGSIYESLLELVPKHSALDRSFELVPLAGNKRKSTGSYYTPASLIECLLDSTLDPVIDDAVKRGDQAATEVGDPDPTDHIVAELLSLTVCDPACGSGHFLVAAARRIAKRLAAVREHNPEPTVDAVREALREVIARCIYGVDLNPMAVELAKVALWLEAIRPGKPLGFLDAHVKCGNALIGATPALLDNGIPDKAFKPIESDDKKIARALQKRNEQERQGQLGLFDLHSVAPLGNSALASSVRRITSMIPDELAVVRQQEQAYSDLAKSPSYVRARQVADAWCAAFMWRKTADAPPAITNDVFDAIQAPDETVSNALLEEIVRLREQYNFFHWHLEFPDIFAVSAGDSDVDSPTGWSGGFSCVLGNPPWDKLDFEDKKYFSVVEPSIAALSGAARRRRIAEWLQKQAEAGSGADVRYLAARRQVKSTFHFAGSSMAFGLCAEGLSTKGVNSLQVDHLFTERFATIVAPKGRFGCIVPTSVATGAGAQHLFADFSHRGVITLLYDFENRKLLFPGLHASYKFCLLSVVGQSLREPLARFAFFLLDTSDLDRADRVFELSVEDLARINPNTRTLPIFRFRRDADLTASIYERVPVLWDERRSRDRGNYWGVVFKRLIDLTDDSDIFKARAALECEGWSERGGAFLREGCRMLPLYEGKMAYHFDHRWNSFHGVGNEDHHRMSQWEKEDPAAVASPRHWVPEVGPIEVKRNGRDIEVPGVAEQLGSVGWERDWVYGWRDICRSTDERTAIPAIIPRAAVGNTFPLMLPKVPSRLVAALAAVQSSLVFDFVSRQKIGGIHMALMTWKQLPVPTPQMLDPHVQFITPRVLELVYTAYDIAGLAKDLDDEGPPFQWDEYRRAQMRAELDAYVFHLYGVGRDDVDYILESFQSDSGGGLKNNEIAKYGHYRTKKLVLAEYDRMAEAGVNLETPLLDGENFTSRLTPPPGNGPRHPAEPDRANDLGAP